MSRDIRKIVVELDLSDLDDAPIKLEQLRGIHVIYDNIAEGMLWDEEVPYRIIEVEYWDEGGIEELYGKFEVLDRRIKARAKHICIFCGKTISSGEECYRARVKGHRTANLYCCIQCGEKFLKHGVKLN